jgi:phage recombination protein Bet
MTTQPGTDMIPYSERLGVSTIVEHGQLSEDQVAYFVAQFKGCPEADIKGFFWVVERYELNPFGVAQIYGVPRSVNVKGDDGQWHSQKRLTVQVGINGLVKIAQKTGRFAGMTEPLWAGEDGIWRNLWTRGRFQEVTKKGRSGSYTARELVIEPPSAAKVGVSVVGVAAPSWGVANWFESADFDDKGEPRNLWKTKPAMMLAKTAAALALRRTFQDEFQSLTEQLRGARVQVTVREDDPQSALYGDRDEPELHDGFVMPDDPDEPEPPAETHARPAPDLARQVANRGDPSEFWALSRSLNYKGQDVAPAVFGVPTMLAWLNSDPSLTWDDATSLLRAAAAKPQDKPSDQLRETGEPEPGEGTGAAQAALGLDAPVQRAASARGA